MSDSLLTERGRKWLVRIVLWGGALAGVCCAVIWGAPRAKAWMERPAKEPNGSVQRVLLANDRLPLPIVREYPSDWLMEITTTKGKKVYGVNVIRYSEDWCSYIESEVPGDYREVKCEELHHVRVMPLEQASQKGK